MKPIFPRAGTLRLAAAVGGAAAGRRRAAAVVGGVLHRRGGLHHRDDIGGNTGPAGAVAGVRHRHQYRVTAFARRAVYPQAKASRTPPDLWRRYLLRGRAEYAGMVKVAPELARKVSFSNLNLLHAAHFQHSRFDVIFLRNVLIYFDEATKLRVLLALCDKLREGGHLIIGHSESIRHLELPLTQEAPSRYRLDSRFADGRIDEHRRSDC